MFVTKTLESIPRPLLLPNLQPILPLEKLEPFGIKLIGYTEITRPLPLKNDSFVARRADLLGLSCLNVNLGKLISCAISTKLYITHQWAQGSDNLHLKEPGLIAGYDDLKRDLEFGEDKAEEAHHTTLMSLGWRFDHMEGRYQ